MADWFEHAGGLRFSCTMCGNCCSGPAGYVLVTDNDVAALARRRDLPEDEFRQRYTRRTRYGLSLVEVETEHGHDCVFLDRDTVPGKALCAVYEDRPAQCRTWPFWKSNLRNERAWRLAQRICPGMGRGRLYTPQQIRIRRDEVDM